MVRKPSNLTKLGDQTGRDFRTASGFYRANGLYRTFIIGIVLGALGTGASIYFIPAVDLYRERSITSVQPNGGNVEVLRINLPGDRILVGLAGTETSIPAELDWPGAEHTGGMQAELFKLRDRNNTVIGVASRLASFTETQGSFIEWALHFPARGTMYARMELIPSADGIRNGILRAGTREFFNLSGVVGEKFISQVDDDDSVQSRIQLLAALVSQLEESE